jgi:hypothetical protein
MNPKGEILRGDHGGNGAAAFWSRSMPVCREDSGHMIAAASRPDHRSKATSDWLSKPLK